MTAWPLKEPLGLVLAATVSPLAPALVMGLGSDYPYALPAAVLAYMFAAFANAVVGLPLLFWGLRLRLVAWWSAAIVGFGAGVLADVVIHLTSFPPRRLSELVSVGAIGSLTAFTFWAVRRLALGKARSLEPIV